MATATANIDVGLQPKQSELYDMCEESIANVIGYGGSRGGGKSGALRRIMLLRRLSNPGTAGLIFRRVYDDLKRNHIDKFFEEFPSLFKYYRATDHEILLPATGDNPPSRIVFGYAETLQEVKRKFHGPEYMDMFLDQAEQLTEEEVNIMRTACRWPGVGRNQCKLVLFFNPGGVGISYLKRVFHEHRYLEGEIPSDYYFIQAYGWDNVEWVRSSLIEDGHSDEDFYEWDNEARFDYFIRHSQYGRQLNSLPQALRIGYLMGSFDTFAGQYFDCWDWSRMTIPSEDLLIEHWHPKWISIDWGYSHESAIYWWAQDGNVTKTYRELVISHKGPRALAQMIIDASTMFEGEEIKSIDAIYISPDSAQKRTDEDTIHEQMSKVFNTVGMPRPRMANDHRVSGFMLMHEMLNYGTWKIGRNCPRLIANLPLFSRDSDNPEDCVKFVGDDPGDSARYGLKSRFAAREEPWNIQLDRQLASAKKELSQKYDPAQVNTMMHLRHLQIEAKKKKKMQVYRRIKLGNWRHSG